MDKLLGAIKDFSAVRRCLAAINRTTNDFLFFFDFSDNTIQFYGPIRETFPIQESENENVSFKDFLSIVYPADRKELRSTIKDVLSGKKESHDINFRVFNRSGNIVWVNSRGQVFNNESGEPSVMLGRLSEEAVRHLFDPETGLWNKTKLREDLKADLNNEKGWLMLLGIPSLTDINLSYGSDFGNQILCEVSDALGELDWIKASYHVEDNIFGLVVYNCDSERLEEIYQWINQKMREKCSVFAGAVPIDRNAFIDASQIIDSANVTLNDAVQGLAENVVFFSPEDMSKRISELMLLEELKDSVQNGFEGFEVYYQPQIRSGSYDLYGIESLLRYHSKEGRQVFPDEFIPLLERSGLIVPVGMWVLETSLAQCRKWRKSIPNLQVSVNFSSVQFEDSKLGEKIIKALKTAGLPGEALTIELTESIQLNENKNFYNIIKYVKANGVRFAIDDFGTGYSNLGYLKQLDISEIKIDRSFVSEIERNTYNYNLITNVIEFAKTNSIHTCCEGVENVRELSVLEPLQADFFQGYLFDKPCTAVEIEQKYMDSCSEKFKARLSAVEEIQRFQRQFGAIYFDPKNILRENDIGLWIIRFDRENNQFGLYVDGVMEKVLGLTEKLSPEACYDYWYSRVLPTYKEYVDKAFSTMINDNKAVQMEYYWQHPGIGRVLVRSSGIRTNRESTVVILEGYHRTLTGLEGANEIMSSKEQRTKNENDQG